MTQAIRQFLRGAFSIITLIALLLGAIAFVLFLAGLIGGGPTATQLAVTAGNIMNWGIKLATAAVVVGIVEIYLSRQHKLTLAEEGKEAKPAAGTTAAGQASDAL